MSITYGKIEKAIVELTKLKQGDVAYSGVTPTDICRWLRQNEESLWCWGVVEMRPEVKNILEDRVLTGYLTKGSTVHRYRIHPKPAPRNWQVMP